MLCFETILWFVYKCILTCHNILVNKNNQSGGDMLTSVFMGALLLGGELAGITLPDEISSNNQVLSLNGMGLREFLLVDIYVAGLYLPFKSSDPTKIINADVPKRIEAHFILPKVPKDRMIKSLMQNLNNNKEVSENIQEEIQMCMKFLQDFQKGDVMIFDYLPNKGTSIIINGALKGTIPGFDFGKAVFTIYVGPKPASAQLKKGLLGP